MNKSGFRAKDDPQTPQEYDFSSLCVCICRTKNDLHENEKAHTLQACGFFSVFTFLCLLKDDTSEKEEPDISEEHSFTPVDVQCTIKCNFWKELETSQLCSFSPEHSHTYPQETYTSLPFSKVSACKCQITYGFHEN